MRSFMRRFRTLTALFLKQLIRRKLLWAILALLAVMMLVNYFVLRTMEESLGRGESYDVATRRATASLQSSANQIRGYAIALVLLTSALIAPAARKDGTTQFALSLAVSRLSLAAAQFAALAAFIGVSVVIVHLGYAVAALRLNAMSASELALAWLWLLVPLLLLAAAVFAISLRWSAIGTYVIFVGVAFLALPLAEATLTYEAWAKHVPLFVSRLVDNAAWLYPQTYSLIVWPQVSLAGRVSGAPHPQWTWTVVHTLLSTSFWVALGVWAYLRHDFGSRMPTR